MRAATKIAAFNRMIGFGIRRRATAASEVAPEIHAGVEALNLVGISVEHFSAPVGDEARQPLLARLAPAWMVHGRVHVGVEPVLVARHGLPRVERLLLDEPHPDRKSTRLNSSHSQIS